MLITDSFHGTAFATNLNTDFLAFIPKYGGRIYNLLNIVSLQERAITDFNDISAADKPIDFTTVNAVLNAERKKADDYIDFMIEKCEDKIKSRKNK